jgi:ABC transporter ATM
MQRKEANQYDIKVSAKLADSLLNYETVVLSGNEKAELKSFNKLLQQYQHFSLLNAYSSGTLNAGQGVIIAIGITCSLILTVMGNLQGTMSIGDIVLVQSLLLQLLEPLQFLGWYYSSLKNCFVDLEALLEILLTKSNLKDGSQDLPSSSSQAQANQNTAGLSIALQNVDYSYQSDRQILKGLDLKIKPGESVAVVGSSGSGKSTLLRMILRLYDVDCGRVTIGAYPIKDLKLDSLRASMALIPQDTLMFNDTIYNNVRYGNLNASKEDVLEALQSAQLGSLIDKLPEGHETVVGERGIKLSGGERQRIAIARAILRKPQILVCDEATSSLDSKTESEIMDTLRSVAKGRTCVFISHRLSTVQHCDQIHVLAEGKIVESGTHEELLNKSNGALYKKMWATQEKKPVDTKTEKSIYNKSIYN